MANGYVNLPGTNEYVELDYRGCGTGKLAIIIGVEVADWTPTAQSVLAAQWEATSEKAWLFQYKDNTGNKELQLLCRTSISTDVGWTVANTGWADATFRWIKIEADPGTPDCSVYTTTDAITTDPTSISWGAAAFTPADPASFTLNEASTEPIFIGARNSSTPAAFSNQKVYYLEVWKNGWPGDTGVLVVREDYRTGPDFDGSNQRDSGINGDGLKATLRGTSPTYVDGLATVSLVQTATLSPS